MPLCGRVGTSCHPRRMSRMSEKKQVVLTHDESNMLCAGLINWGGPADGTNALARAMGFANRKDLWEESNKIATAINSGHALSVRDWTRALVATEINFASEVLGTGNEWEAIEGVRDEDCLKVLRSLQVKVPHDRRSLPA